MKFMKRAGIYKANNVTFDPKTLNAYSYAWWRFVAVVEGKVIFNDYRYSNSTSKHQSKVRNLMNDLGIKIDMHLPIAKGIDSRPLAELIIEAEEHLCDAFLNNQLKQQERYQRTKARKFQRKLEDYLDNQACFRDYEIKPKSRFGTLNEIAVHQVVEDIEQDVQNALHAFHRDGFGKIVFYVES